MDHILLGGILLGHGILGIMIHGTGGTLGIIQVGTALGEDITDIMTLGTTIHGTDRAITVDGTTLGGDTTATTTRGTAVIMVAGTAIMILGTVDTMEVITTLGTTTAVITAIGEDTPEACQEPGKTWATAGPGARVMPCQGAPEET